MLCLGADIYSEHISEEYGVTPRQTTSPMDAFSCIGQGINPHGAQLLIAAELASISSVSIISCLYHQFTLAAAMVVYIATVGLKFGKETGESRAAMLNTVMDKGAGQ